MRSKTSIAARFASARVCEYRSIILRLRWCPAEDTLRVTARTRSPQSEVLTDRNAVFEELVLPETSGNLEENLEPADT
jgi:hypothetical protein